MSARAKLHLSSPIEPMEALLVDEIPAGPEWAYEPKWDGFRCLAFRDGDTLQLQSKSGKPLDRYFPEVVARLLTVKSPRFVLDGELVVQDGNELSFDALQQRLHPAESRVRKLSVETQATYLVFDLIEDESGVYNEQPLRERRDLLEKFAKKFLKTDSIRLSPQTTDIKIARGWFKEVGTSTDGIVAKRLDMSYQAGNRHGMQKIKNIRTVDCVVGGFRYATKPGKDGKPEVGSLLLGLYDDTGLLNHVGFTSGLKAAERPALTRKLEKLIEPPGFTGSAPGAPSRWSTERSAQWQPLALKLVVEVSYDHYTGGRFRHGTALLRWRPDKAARQCTIDQVKPAGKAGLGLLAE